MPDWLLSSFSPIDSTLQTPRYSKSSPRKKPRRNRSERKNSSRKSEISDEPKLQFIEIDSPADVKPPEDVDAIVDFNSPEMV